MKQSTRIVFAVLILISLVAIVLVVETWRGNAAMNSLDVDLEVGDVPIYQDGQLVAAVNGEELNDLNRVSFVDAEEGKTQDGWLLSDILSKYLKANFWDNNMRILVSSSSRAKSVELTWAEMKDSNNRVMFVLSGRGTLKLVSLLERLDVRDEWIQDVDKIEVIEP